MNLRVEGKYPWNSIPDVLTILYIYILPFFIYIYISFDVK